MNEITTEKTVEHEEKDENSDKVDESLNKEDKGNKKTVKEAKKEKKDLDTNTNPFEYVDEDEKEIDSLAQLLQTVQQFKNR